MGTNAAGDSSTEDHPKLNLFSLRFSDAAVEAEYIIVHKTARASHFYCLPVLAIFTVTMTAVISKQRGSIVPILTVVLPFFIFVLLWSSSRARSWLRDPRLVSFVFCAGLAWTMCNPLINVLRGLCRIGEELPPDYTLTVSCQQTRAGQPPMAAIVTGIGAPGIIAVATGLQWVNVVCFFVLSNIPLWFYIPQYVTQGTTVTLYSYLGAGSVSLFIAWEILRQERQKFIWRKVALSEAKLEHERTFNGAWPIHLFCRLSPRANTFAAVVVQHFCVMKFGIRLLLSKVSPNASR